MAKAYLVLCYRSVSNEQALHEYVTLALPAIQGAGGRYLARGMPAKTYEAGLNQRTVIIEFDSVAQVLAAHDSPACQAALRALGEGAERDVRVVEGTRVTSSTTRRANPARRMPNQLANRSVLAAPGQLSGPTPPWCRAGAERTQVGRCGRPLD